MNRLKVICLTPINYFTNAFTNYLSYILCPDTVFINNSNWFYTIYSNFLLVSLWLYFSCLTRNRSFMPGYFLKWAHVYSSDDTNIIFDAFYSINFKNLTTSDNIFICSILFKSSITIKGDVFLKLWTKNGCKKYIVYAWLAIIPLKANIPYTASQLLTYTAIYAAINAKL